MAARQVRDPTRPALQSVHSVIGICYGNDECTLGVTVLPCAQPTIETRILGYSECVAQLVAGLLPPKSRCAWL